MGCAFSKPDLSEKKVEVLEADTAVYKTPHPPALHVHASSPSEMPSEETNEVGEEHAIVEFHGEVVHILGGSKANAIMPDYEPPPPPPPEMEQLRCQAVRDMGLDLQSEEPSLDFITQICCDIFQAPICSIMLMDETASYIKSTSHKLIKKAPLDRKFCFGAWMMLSLKPELLVVEDLRQDKRFQNHVAVTGPMRMRSCCCAPLLDRAGHRLGSLEVLDFQPRQYTAEQCLILCNLAAMVVKEMYVLRERNCRLREMEGSQEQNDLSSPKLMSIMEASKEAVVLVDMSRERWPVTLGNKRWNQDTGFGLESGKKKCFWDAFQPASLKQQDASKIWESFETVLRAGMAFDLDVVRKGGSMNDVMNMHFRPATLEDVEGPQTKIPAIGTAPSAQEQQQMYYLGAIKSRSQKPTTPVGFLARYLHEAGMRTGGGPAVEGVVLGSLLGRGSNGSVHKATWNGQTVAVKITTTTTEEELKVGVQQMEVLLGLKLNHPNVVRTLAAGSKKAQTTRTASSPGRLQGTPMDEPFWSFASSGSTDSNICSKALANEITENWIVLELCNLGSLQEAIDRGDFKRMGSQAKWVPDEALITRIALEVASGMAHLHSAGVLHADLNGNNVLLSRRDPDSDFHAKVSDFGLSRATTAQRTIATQTYGTVTHMPPELLREGRLSKAADVYAFGVLFWELITGERPYAGMRHAQIITRKMQDRPGWRLQWPPGTDESLKAIGQQCLLSDPHKRPTFDMVVAILQPLSEKLVGA